MAQTPGPGGTTSPAATQGIPGYNVPAPASADPVASAFGTIATNAPSVAGTSAVGANSTTPIFPGASISPYYLSQIGSTPINLGGGFQGGGTMSLDAAINFFDSLPKGQLIWWESQLEAAGFYTDANNNPLKTAAVLGTLDDQARRAWLNALIAAASSGMSVTDTIANAIQSGQGANLRSNLPQAATGGGNVYTIDLTSPGAVNEVANSIFQATQGRNATAEEEQAITNAVNSGAIAQGLAKEQGAEQASQQQYNTRVNQRNIQFQFETTTKSALGPVPNAPINNSAQYATTLLQFMGMPVNASNIAFFMGMIQANGAGLGGMNPLGSQNAVPGSKPGQTATPSYTSWEQSLQATADAILNGPYSNIVDALKLGNAGSQAGNSAVQAELKKWSGGKFGNISAQVQASQKDAELSAFYAGNAAKAGQPTPGAPTDAQLQNMPGYAAFLKGGGTPEEWRQQMTQELAQAGQGLSPAGVPPGTPTTPAAAVTPGQQQSNPGDQYINPTTIFSQNPLSPEQASYLEATTGPNRFGFAENNFLHAFLAVANMINAGHPTGT